MSALKQCESNNNTGIRNFFRYFPVFKESIYEEVRRSLTDFFRREYAVKFMGITTGDNVLYFGNEYFVNKIAINKHAEVKINISSDLISTLLNDTLGYKEGKFSLKMLTDLEALLLKDFTLLIYENLEKYINKTEVSKKVLKEAQNCCFTFFVKINDKHTGKILVTMPDYVLTNINPPEEKQSFTVGDFKTTETNVNILTGFAKITLNELKSLETEDIIVLDESNINVMAIKYKNENIPFRVKPNPELVLGINTEGEENMSEIQERNPENMWDSIPVDITAEFENVKMTLGELKLVSEGLVIDVGSVYENKIKLKVENKTVASGELVIINDRYGVRITEVTKIREEENPKESVSAGKTVEEKAVAGETKSATKPAASAKKAAPGAKTPSAKAPAKAGAKGDENFDYRDFEIEDESI